MRKRYSGHGSDASSGFNTLQIFGTSTRLEKVAFLPTPPYEFSPSPSSQNVEISFEIFFFPFLQIINFTSIRVLLDSL